MRKQVRLEIHGRVQGVSFRWATCEQAAALGLVGWVRNRADGSVEAVAEGEEEALQALLSWAHRGPPGARVDGVRASWGEPGGRFTSFEIRHG